MTIVRVFLYHKIGQDNQENERPSGCCAGQLSTWESKKPRLSTGFRVGVQLKIRQTYHISALRINQILLLPLHFST